jgi:membrane protease YdiL (CAAX protease family)
MRIVLDGSSLTTEAIVRARRGLAIYFAVLVPLTALVEVRIVLLGGRIGDHVAEVYALMWAPALASLVARIALREGIRDVSFRLGGWIGVKWCLIAIAIPLAVGFAAYGPAWLLGLAEFSPPRLAIGDRPPWAHFLALLGICLSFGLVLSATSAAGEELGWRGYMTTRLIDAGVPRPVLVGSLVWGLWHVPLILSGQYASSASPWTSSALFLVGITAASYVAARARLESGSVWPAIVDHAAWNSIIQGTFDNSTAEAGLWVGESGVLTVIALVAISALLVRGRWIARRHPGEPPIREAVERAP